MQMNALRSLNFLKLSSSNSTSDEYCVTSISAGTPAGYCLSQMRSMVLPSKLLPVVWDGTRCLEGVLSNAEAHGKRRRVLDASRGSENGLFAREGSSAARRGRSVWGGRGLRLGA